MAVIASVSGLNVITAAGDRSGGFTEGAVLWIINATPWPSQALLMPVGAIGDRFRRKPVLLAGLGLFRKLASVGAAVATSTALLIVIGSSPGPPPR
ncbi:MAG: hypothetical protein R2710_30365 [Acidimicrobiales bacterium]